MRCPILLAALLFALWTESAWAIGTTPPSWKPRETVSTMVDSSGMMAADRTLAYDHHGNPGIAYADGALRYARRVPGIGWASSPIIDTLAFYPSLAVDRYERPAISYWQGIGSDLKYARFNGSAWILETIDMAGDTGFHTALAFDLLGRPAIAYSDATNTSLRFVEDTDGDFSLMDETPVTAANQVADGQFTSLAFDPLNRPMVAHYDTTNTELRFSVREPGVGWVTTTVDGIGTTGRFPSIAIDPTTGFPAIAYYSSTELRFAEWDGDSWNATSLDATGNLSGSFHTAASLAFDPADGNPAIAYYTNTGGQNLKLAWHDGSSWQTQTVDSVGDIGRSPSLAFNDYGNGFPSIVYSEFSPDFDPVGLYYIEDPPAPAVPEPISQLLVACAVIAGCVCDGRHGSRPPSAKHRTSIV